MSTADKSEPARAAGRRPLVIALAVVILGLVTYKFLWPSVIKPLVDLSDQIASETKKREKLDEKLAEGDKLSRQYTVYVERNGGVNVNKVRDGFREALNSLITQTGLRDGNISSTEPRTDRKKDTTTLSYTVGAEGTLQQTVEFLRRFYEVPYVARVKSLNLTPQTGTGKERGKTIDSLTISGTIEVLVLPENKFAAPLPADITQPENVPARHRGEDYSLIWERTPFSDWVPPPQGACCLGSQCVLATAAQCADQSGTYKGDNSRCQPNPCEPPPPPEAPKGACCIAGVNGKPAACTFVTAQQCVEQGGEYKGDSIQCSANPCGEAVVVIDDGPNTEPETRDPLGQFKLVRAALLYGRDEIRVHNTQNQKNEYVTVGAAMDGGELVLVHPQGVVVHRQDGDFMYPLGKTFAESAPLAPREYPEIYLALKALRKQREAAAALEDASSATAHPDSEGEAVAASQPADNGETPVAEVAPPAAPDDDQAYSADLARLFMGQAEAPTTYPTNPIEPSEDFVGPPYVPGEP